MYFIIIQEIMRLLWQVLDGKAYGFCYLVSNLNCMSLLTNKEISIDLYRAFLKEMIWKWHNPKSGRLFTSWPNETLKRRKDNMGDTITVSEIKVFSPLFRVNIFKKVPMVVSINVWDQFRVDREDGKLDDTVFDDITTTWHDIVIQWLRMYDSRRDQKNYSITRTYLTNVKGLFKSRTALVFKKV
jgi:hypothetical protein